MKTFSERNPFVVGGVGVGIVLAVTVVALNYDKLPFLDQDTTYSAYFAEAGGLIAGAPVQVSGLRVGKVDSIELDGARVLVTFNVAKDIRLGDRTEAAVKTKSLLGAKIIEVTPRGDGSQSGPIPIERTRPAYQLPDALGDVTKAISGLDTNQLSESLAVLADTFADTPPDLKVAVEGIARFSETLDKRDAALRDLLTDANKTTKVLSERSDQVVDLVVKTNSLLAQLNTQSSALGALSNNIAAVTRQIKGFIGDNRSTLKPALEKLNGVLKIVNDRKDKVDASLVGLNRYAAGLGESVGSGPFFKAYVGNLLPGQFLQPFIDAAFSDLGLDPNILPPSQITDPQLGQPGTPALPIPYPRTGQGGEPRDDPSRCDHRQSRRSRLWSARRAIARAYRLLPLPGAAARAATGRAAAGTARAVTAEHAVDGHTADAQPAARARSTAAGDRTCRGTTGAAPTGRRAVMKKRIALGRRLGGHAGCRHPARQRDGPVKRTRITAYFANTNGLFAGDEVWILGVPVGKIDTIEPQPERAKVTFFVDDKYKVPANANAVILSPQLVPVRAIQLTPAYTGGTGARRQRGDPARAHGGTGRVRRLTQATRKARRRRYSRLSLAESAHSARSSIPAADNLRGEGVNIRDTVIKLSQAFSALGDNSTDLFSTFKNLSILVSALQDSKDLLRQLNAEPRRCDQCARRRPRRGGQRRARHSTTSSAMSRASWLTTAKLSARQRMSSRPRRSCWSTISPQIKEALHVAPNSFQNFLNIYQPAQGTLTGALAVNNFANPHPIHLRRNPGGLTLGRGAVGEAMCAISRSDLQEPAIQLPATWREPLRRCSGAAERDHLQRGLAASGLRSTAGRQRRNAARAAAARWQRLHEFR